jgi:hypothetical protein
LPRPQWSNVVAGVFTFYLVATARATVRRRDRGAFEMGAFAAAALVAAGGLVLGVLARHNRALTDGAPAAAPFVFAAIAALAAAGDLRLCLAGRLPARTRTARHLWRMCLALFIAAGSLFLGQPQVFPPALRGSIVLVLPEVAVLALMLFWLARVGATGR